MKWRNNAKLKQKLFTFPSQILEEIYFMNKEEILKSVGELRATIEKASEIVDKLSSQLPVDHQPAMNAQCNVIRTFLWQLERQEHIFSSMIQKKLQS